MPLAQTLSIIGVAGVASYAFARLAVRTGWVRWYRYAVIHLPREGLPRMPAGFSADEALAIETGSTEEFRRNRMRDGMSCIVVRNRKGECVAAAWIGPGDCAEDDVALRFRIPAGTAWDTGMWVHPDHRLGRAFSALIAALGEWMDRNGIAGSYSRIADYNLASLTAHRRLGARMIGHHGVLKLGPWQWCTQARPRFIRTTGGRRAELVLPKPPSP
jgi:GNAT superfamily N-acetyltransferase